MTPGPSPSDFARQLADYRLTTAKILYHMPDHPGLLQEYIWQNLDVAPRFPELRRFLDFWTRELDGPLHSVEVASLGVIKPAGFRKVDCLLVH
jgi:uncharacterized protein Usg